MKRVFPLGLLLLAAACEVLETDLSDSKVRVIAPADGITVAAGEVAFRWAAVESAAGYEFTVVGPSFVHAQRVVADTVIYADTLDRRFGCVLLLDAGEYEWCVSGFNGGYATQPVCRRLTVVADQAPDTPDDSGSEPAREIPAP